MSPRCVHAMSVCRALTLIGDAKCKGKSGPVETRLVVTALLSCPPRMHLPARNSLVNKGKFLGLIPQNWWRPMRLRDQ